MIKYINSPNTNYKKGKRHTSPTRLSGKATKEDTDNQLKGLILKMPRTKEELKTIRGVGDEKVDKYGDDILKIVEKFESVGPLCECLFAGARHCQRRYQSVSTPYTTN